MLPLLYLRGVIPFENEELEIEFSRPQSITAIESALKEHEGQLVAVPQVSLNEKAVKTYSQLSDFGLVGRVSKFVKHKDEEGVFVATIKFGRKVKIVKPVGSDTISSNNIDFIELPELEFNEDDLILMTDLPSMLVKASFLKTNSKLYQSVITLLADKKYLSFLDRTMLIASGGDFTILFNYFEQITASAKIFSITNVLFGHTEDPELESNTDAAITKKLSEQMAKQQTEFYLREKLKLIKEELGEITSKEDESEKIKRLVKNNPYPKHIKEKILSELVKYETAFTSNEAGLAKSYIDWLIELPWWQKSVDNTDLNKVQKVLESNHYGIEKVKERILEYIAVNINNPKSKAPIICLVGPPGVGKTSLARSIAEALNKEFVKVALGGVKDESEIRGHRKTYLGAMPGRIIKAMKKAKTINPLFLLDEIDKMSSDHKGDPASALLEVLDPEQNKTFSDNYIEEDYDLSQVMFICTANYYNQIPEALIDRLEVIELSSYTLNEKKHIAEEHLIKRVAENTGLKTKDIKFTVDAIDHIINYYTREAGVRELQRLIEQIVRKILVLKLKGEEYPTKITPVEVEKLLGKKRFDLTLKDKTPIAGIVNGMAYTSAGGDLLPIEATFFKGKGNVIITGNLEQTMTESVNVAFGYVKSNAVKFGIENIDLSELDLHLHVPSGGIPKDGPSAGVTITTAILSALKQVSIPTNVSMTGEIMLRGKVGIIGGVKEKVISAHRAGVRNIFIPKDDERYLEDVPHEIKKDLNITLVEVYDEIYDALFKDKKSKPLTTASTPKKACSKVSKEQL